MCSEIHPLVSVIISSYNHTDYIEKSISSVFDQTYDNIELLVIDDGSTDNSVKKIQELQKKFLFDFQVQENKGLTRTLNEAVKRTKGGFILFLGSDDIMLPNRIALQVEYMKDKPEVGICGGNMELIDAQGNLLPPEKQRYKNAPTGRFNFNDVFTQNKNVPSIPTQLFRKDVFEKVGGFNPEIRLDDIYIWLKITHAGYYIDRINALLSQYRVHPTNTYKNLRFMSESLLKIYADYSDHPQYQYMRNRILNSQFLKASSRDKKLARELLKQIPLSAWNGKMLRGAFRLLFS